MMVNFNHIQLFNQMRVLDSGLLQLIPGVLLANQESNYSQVLELSLFPLRRTTRESLSLGKNLMMVSLHKLITEMTQISAFLLTSQTFPATLIVIQRKQLQVIGAQFSSIQTGYLITLQLHSDIWKKDTLAIPECMIEETTNGQLDLPGASQLITSLILILFQFM